MKTDEKKSTPAKKPAKPAPVKLPTKSGEGTSSIRKKPGSSVPGTPDHGILTPLSDKKKSQKQ